MLKQFFLLKNWKMFQKSLTVKVTKLKFKIVVGIYNGNFKI